MLKGQHNFTICFDTLTKTNVAIPSKLFNGFYLYTSWRRKWLPTRVLPWEILWTEKPGGLQSMGLQESDMIQRINNHYLYTSTAAVLHFTSPGKTILFIFPPLIFLPNILKSYVPNMCLLGYLAKLTLSQFQPLFYSRLHHYLQNKSVSLLQENTLEVKKLKSRDVQRFAQDQSYLGESQG